MSKPGGQSLVSRGLDQMHAGQSYQTPMAQQVADAARPVSKFNGQLANMGAQMLNGGGGNVGEMLPQIMQMFHNKPPQAAQSFGQGSSGYGIGQPPPQAQPVSSFGRPNNMPVSLWGGPR